MLNVPQEIKDILHLDSAYKNIRIHFPNGERSDICNDLIVKDSVSLKESLCSQNELKFGLCESPVFECETVGVGNVKGATIEVACEVECPSSVTGAEWKNDLQKFIYAIPYGEFVVAEAKRQADMNHRKITAYNIWSLYDWKMAQSEAAKAGVMFKNQADYTPEMLYSLMASGLKFDESVFSKTAITRNNTLTSTLYTASTVQQGTGNIYTLTVYYDTLIWGKRGSTSYNDYPADALYTVECNYDYEAIDRILDIFVNNSPIKNTDHNRALSFFAKKYRDANIAFVADGGYAAIAVPSDSWRRSHGYSGDAHDIYCYPYMDDDYYTATAYDAYIYFSVPVRVNYKILAYVNYVSTTILDETEIINNAQFYQRELEQDYQFMSQRIKYTRALSADTAFNLNNQRGYFIDFDSFDLKKFVPDWFEMLGLFGYFSRTGVTPVNIKRKFELLPSSTLYPGDNVYPDGVVGGKLLPNDYQSCWYDDGYTKPIGYVICNYTNTADEKVEYLYYFQGYTESSDCVGYDLSSNAVIQGSKWTDVQIQAICANFESKVKGVSYMPVEFVGRGLPYVEAGDTFEILTKSNDSITTIVLNRTISGEQVLKDSYKSV